MDELNDIDKAADFPARSLGKGFFWPLTLLGVLIVGTAYILSSVGLAIAGYTYDNGNGTPIIGNPEALLLFKIILFTIPFFIGALYFRYVFRYSKHRPISVISALLIAWAAEKLAILGISSMIYSIGIWDFPQLMYRISAGGDQSAPWFTLDYVLFTLAGCIVLGLLASLGKRAYYNDANC